MKVLVVKTINGFLKPAYDSDSESFSKIPFNEIVEIEYKKKRNIRFHRKFFALLKLAYENQSDYKTMEIMRHDIIVTAGFFDEIINLITGEVYKKAHSISFDSMDEIEFNKVYDGVKEVICQWLGLDNNDIESNIEQYF